MATDIGNMKIAIDSSAITAATVALNTLYEAANKAQEAIAKLGEICIKVEE